MGNKTCCCFGHREMLWETSVPLAEILLNLVEKKEVNIFYTGGMGEFDLFFSSLVRNIKRSHPEIRLILVSPYLTKKIYKSRSAVAMQYDTVLIPTELAGVHFKSAIKKRNRWLVDHSDYIISYVKRPFGGAFEAVNYAKKQKKIIVPTLEL